MPNRPRKMPFDEKRSPKNTILPQGREWVGVIIFVIVLLGAVGLYLYRNFLIAAQ